VSSNNSSKTLLGTFSSPVPDLAQVNTIPRETWQPDCYLRLVFRFLNISEFTSSWRSNVQIIVAVYSRESMLSRLFILGSFNSPDRLSRVDVHYTSCTVRVQCTPCRYIVPTLHRKTLIPGLISRTIMYPPVTTVAFEFAKSDLNPE
jgi:hypothetical protein